MLRCPCIHNVRGIMDATAKFKIIQGIIPMKSNKYVLKHDFYMCRSQTLVFHPLVEAD